jgi:iron(III) transport system substrate-binding protein
MRNLLLLMGLAIAVATSLGNCNQLRAQPLVLDGEEIADAKLVAAAKAEGKISIYSTNQTELMAEVLDSWKKNVGIEIEYLRVPTVKLYDRVLAEFTAGKLDVDYANLTDLTLIKEWLSRGILAAHKVPWDVRIAPELKHPEGRWYYSFRSMQTIAVNTELVKEAEFPKSFKDLYEPKWKGKLGTQTVEAGGSALTLFAFLRMRVGPDSWERLAAVEPRTYATSAPMYNDIVRGRIAAALGTASAFSEAIENGAPLKIMFPAEGMATFGSMGNVTSTAKHPNAGRLWVNFLTSKHAANFIAKQGVYATHPDAPRAVAAGYTFPPQHELWNISPDQWDSIQKTWPDEWRKIFGKK